MYAAILAASLAVSLGFGCLPEAAMADPIEGDKTASESTSAPKGTDAPNATAAPMKRPDASKLKDCVAYFTFDDKEKGLEFTNANGTVKATVVGEKIGQSDDGTVGKGFLMPEGNDSYLKVAYADGKSIINGTDGVTISYWSKTMSSTAEYYGWTFFCKDKSESQDKRRYIGTVDRYDKIEAERHDGANGSDKTTLDQSAITGVQGAWKMVTVVYTSTDTSVYINGKLSENGKKEIADTDTTDVKLSEYLKADGTGKAEDGSDVAIGSEFSIGYAPWGSGEYYQGYLDEYAIMNSAYSAEDVESLYKSYAFDASKAPTLAPSPTPKPTAVPTVKPTKKPSAVPTTKPTDVPAKPTTPVKATIVPAKATATAAPTASATAVAPAATATAAPVVGSTFTAKNAKYKVTSVTEAAFVGTVSKKVTSALVPDSISNGTSEFKVTAIANNAFKKCTKLKKVVIGANVTAIGKTAFSGCSKLKAITVKSAVIKSVGKNAFKGIAKKAVFTFPKAKFSAYKKAFKGKGQKTCKYKKK